MMLSRPVVKWVVAAVAALTLVALAVTRPGFAQEAVELNDQSVWITNLSQLKVGRFNQPIEELTGVMMAAAPQFDVMQEAQRVVLSEPGTIRPVNPASVQAEDGTRLAGETYSVMGGGVVVSVDRQTGQGWVRPADRLGGWHAQADVPDLELGSGGAATVSPDGAVMAVKAGGQVLQASLAGDRVQVAAAGQLARAPGQIDGLTAVGHQIYALSGTTLVWTEGAVDLSQYGQELVLQAPAGPASEVAVASETALLLIDRGGRVTRHQTGVNGRPAQPVRVGDCLHAAWAASGPNYLAVCSGAAPEPIITQALEEVSRASLLVFRVNRQVVVLNDVADGRLWLPEQDAQVRRPNWNEAELKAPPNQITQPQDTSLDQPVDCARQAGSPTARDDHYGIRPGATQVLMVLSNDVAGGCGALGILEVGPVEPKVATAQVVYQGRAIQLSVKPDVFDSFSFTYTVRDGRGLSVPSTAEVTVEVVPEAVNRPPEVLRPGRVVMEQGSLATYQVLPGFFDPDGDPLHLVAASSAAGWPVGFQADGQLAITGVGEPGETTVAVTVSDGRELTEGVVEVDLRPARSLAPVLDPAMAQGYAGQPVDIAVFDSLRSYHAAAVTLQAVAPLADATVEFDPETGVVTFEAAIAKTYYLEVTVLSGDQAGRGVVRIDLAQRPDSLAAPIAVQDTVYLRGGAPDTIDPLLNDLAPSGGVPLVSEVDVPQSLGVKVAVIDHQYLEVIPLSDGAGLTAASGSFTYTLWVDGQPAQGNVLVVRAPAGLSQSPLLAPISLTVKTGGVVTLPVLERALDLDGQALRLEPSFPTGLAEGQGRAYVSDQRLRYQAPDTPMTVQIAYQVVTEAGRQASGLATVRVHQSQGAAKAHPAPRLATGRVLAGQTSRVAIDLTGIDIDGDGVSLQGLDTAPTLGRVVEVGADYLEYQAFPSEQGTDTFTYAVEDWVGMRAVATVQVAVAPRPDSGGGVVARDDELTVRPGESLEIRVLNNDLDLDGGALELCGKPVSPDPAVQVSYVGQRLAVQVPGQGGPAQIEYTACNQTGGKDHAMVRLRIDPNAPFQAPTVGDVVVKPADTVNQVSVDVNVLALADNPSGPLSDLVLSLPGAGPALAQAKDGGIVTVTLQSEPAMVFFQLTNRRPEAAGVRAYGYIAVPALGTFPPMLRPGEADITVLAGQSVELGLARYVMVGPGKRACLAEPATIHAAKTDGSQPYKDATTLLYAADPTYAGPASITFKVADSDQVANPHTRVAVLTLPITVLPASEVAPTLNLPLLELERAGDPITIDLAGQVNVLGGPVPAKDLAIKVTDQVGQGVTARLNGTVLSLAATKQAQVGASGALGLVISYDRGTAVPASVEWQVSAVARRLVSLVPVSPQVVDQAQSRTIEVLAGAWNPAPEAGELSLTKVSVSPPTAGTAQPAGQAIAVTPGANHVGLMVVSYQVNDALGEPDRQVSGAFTVKVRGKPEAPGPPRPGTPGDGQVTLTWDPPEDNGAPISDYLVSYQGGSQVCPHASCTLTGLVNGRSYAFTVQARNAVGLSTASPPSGLVLVDLVPGAPTGVNAQAGQRSVRLTWAAPPAGGSAVTRYTVWITGGPTSHSQTVSGNSATFHGLVAGATYTFGVTAHNAHPQPSEMAVVSAVPYDTPSQPSLTVSRLDAARFAASLGSVQANGSPPRYSLHVVAGDGGERVYCEASTASPNCIFPTTPGVTYTIWAEVVNQTGTPVKSEAQVLTQYSKPVLTAVNLTWDGVAQDAGQGRLQAAWDGVANPGEVKFLITLDGTSEVASKPGSKTFHGLWAGRHTLKVQVCHAGLTGVGSVAAETCSEPQTKSVDLRTRPAVPTYSVKVVPQANPGGNPKHLAQVVASVDSDGGWPNVALTYAINQGQWRPVGRDTDLGSVGTGQIQVRACPASRDTEWCATAGSEPFP